MNRMMTALSLVAAFVALAAATNSTSGATSGTTSGATSGTTSGATTGATTGAATGATVTGGSTGTTGGSSTATTAGSTTTTGGAATTSGAATSGATTSSGAATTGTATTAGTTATTGTATTAGTTSATSAATTAATSATTGSQTTGGGSPSPPPTTTTAAPGNVTAAKTVTVQVTIKALDFTKLQANATLKAELTDSIKTAFLTHLGAGYTKDHLVVVYSSGSVKASVTITALASASAAELQTTMASKQSELMTTVMTKVKAMPSVSNLLQDGKTLNDIDVAVAVDITHSTTPVPIGATAANKGTRSIVSAILVAAVTMSWLSM